MRKLPAWAEIRLNRQNLYASDLCDSRGIPDDKNLILSQKVCRKQVGIHDWILLALRALQKHLTYQYTTENPIVQVFLFCFYILYMFSIQINRLFMRFFKFWNQNTGENAEIRKKIWKNYLTNEVKSGKIKKTASCLLVKCKWHRREKRCFAGNSESRRLVKDGIRKVG